MTMTRLRTFLLILISIAVAPPTLAQSNDAALRVVELEEQVRRLNGMIEDLSFQVLQMQEQIRRIREDNEFRFQELEQRQGGLPPTENPVAGVDTGDPDLELLQSPPDAGETQLAGPGPTDGQTGGNLLGTITFDSLGNVVDTALGKPLDLTGGLGADEAGPIPQLEGADQTALADPNLAEGEGQLYERGYRFVQTGDYMSGEQAFTAFSELYPDSPRIAEARFWLGESLLAQGKFEEAARVFLDAHTNWPDSRMGAQTLLKLGVTMAGMSQRELACATYAKVHTRYPAMANSLRARVEAEQQSANCTNG